MPGAGLPRRHRPATPDHARGSRALRQPRSLSQRCAHSSIIDESRDPESIESSISAKQDLPRDEFPETVPRNPLDDLRENDVRRIVTSPNSSMPADPPSRANQSASPTPPACRTARRDGSGWYNLNKPPGAQLGFVQYDTPAARSWVIGGALSRSGVGLSTVDGPQVNLAMQWQRCLSTPGTS